MEKEKKRRRFRAFGCRRLFWTAATVLGLMCSLPFILNAPELHWHIHNNIRQPLITPAPASKTSDLIAFICKWRRDSRLGAIYTIRPDGSDLRKIRARPYEEYSQFSWSPDGAWLVFVATNHFLTMLPEERYEIYRVRFDGLDSRRVTYNRLIELAPIWSYDGRSILFMSRRVIYEISVEGHEISRTHNAYAPNRMAGRWGRRAIDWTSDGRRIIGIGTYDALLYGRKRDASDWQVLTRAEMRPDALAWANDDERFLYYSNGFSYEFSKLAVFDVKKKVEHFSLELDLIIDAHWSPDARWIAIKGRMLGESDEMHIFLVDADSGDMQRLTTMRAGDFGAISWSPDSEWIAFSTYPRSGGNSRIFKIRRDGASLQQLIEIDCHITEISWSPT